MNKGIQSIEIGAQVLRALVAAGAPVTLKALAASVGMSPSKARMYLVSLIRTELAAQDAASGLYSLGSFAAQLGSVALRQIDPMRLAQDVAHELSGRTGAQVLLSVLGHAGITIVARSAGSDHLPIDFRIGAHVSMTHTATGRAFLAFLPMEVTEEHLDRELQQDFPDPGARQAAWRRLVSAADRVRQRGLAVSEEIPLASGITLTGYAAVAAPILNGQGRAQAVVTALYKRSLPAAEQDALHAAVAAAAGRISALTGGVGPPSAAPAREKPVDRPTPVRKLRRA